MSTPASTARPMIGSSRSRAVWKRISRDAAAAASPTAWAPSTRNRASFSRIARFLRRTARATFRFLREVITARPLGGGSGRVLGAAGASGRLDQRGEGLRVAHREVGQDLAVELHPRLLQAVHEGGVRHAVLSGGGPDPRDPQPPEL